MIVQSNELSLQVMVEFIFIATRLVFYAVKSRDSVVYPKKAADYFPISYFPKNTH